MDLPVINTEICDVQPIESEWATSLRDAMNLPMITHKPAESAYRKRMGCKSKRYQVAIVPPAPANVQDVSTILPANSFTRDPVSQK